MPGKSRNAEVDFKGQKRSNTTHASVIRIIGGRYQAHRVVLDAGRNLHIDGAIDAIRKATFTRRPNFITITTIREGFERESVRMPEIHSTEKPEFNIGGDVHIAGWRGQSLNASLLRTIERGDFENALASLYTPQDRTDARQAAREIDRKYLRDYDLPGASEGQQFAYLDTLIQEYGATYHTIRLRDHAWYDKQVRLNPAFQALLQAVASYITAGAGAGLGIRNAFLQAGVNAATANTVSGIASGAITGDIDIDGILRGAVLAGASATISGYLTDKTDPGKTDPGKTDLGAGLSDTSPFVQDARDHFAFSAIVDRAGDTVINKVVANVVDGKDPLADFGDLGLSILTRETMAIAQYGIGELGHGNANWEGSVGHLLLHGGVGCVALEVLNGNCTAGVFAGASSAHLAGSNLSDKQKLELAPIVGAFAALPFANGDAINVSFGATITKSAIENNYLTHRDVQNMIADVRQCTLRNGGETCPASDLMAIREKYDRISDERYALLERCTTFECINRVLKPVDSLDTPISSNDQFTYAVTESPEVSELLYPNYRYTVQGSFSLEQARANARATNSFASHCEAGDIACVEQARRLWVNGAIKIVVGSLGVGGISVCGSVTAGMCAIAVAGGLVGADTAIQGASEVVSGKIQLSPAERGLIEAGLSPSDARKFWNQVETGVVVLTVVNGVAIAVRGSKVVRSVKIKTNKEAINKGAQIAFNRQNGAVFEQQVVDALKHIDGIKNSTPLTVTLPSGKQVTTIPDLWGRNTGGIMEVKNVQTLSNSNQLRAQLQYAEMTGTPFNLVVSPRTQSISNPLRARIDAVTRKVGGGIYRYDPSTGKLSDF